ncbi:putative membrane protein [Propionispora sp. 2/2-37]|uniref:GDSL-type esterase/lipase family protein n=1 Tax=Propionispora sp. 2/2-37 TaxID=1677858 RepID=UPI0006BB54DF|nr:GDSL-type esterase/lipase family protein [Propionispora sp. 2/2-37]CUH97036.1 putative membrane protein [Propionispora sp. 2/2-37]
MKRGKTITTVVVILAIITVGEFMYFGYEAFWGPFKGLTTLKITHQYDTKRQNEIVFYGASNFARWDTMEKDLAGYKVQNHGFGGSTDKDLLKYADTLLFSYNPRIVFFQTGSNDYVDMTGTDAEKVSKVIEYKRDMFAKFHERLPNATFVVMSGLLLPGRSEYTPMTQEINRQLQDICNKHHDYMYFVDASKMTYDGMKYDETLFVEDRIHLNQKGHDIWTKDYIVPAIERIIKEKALESVRK